jgi:hypothetical protein
LYISVTLILFYENAIHLQIYLTVLVTNFGHVLRCLRQGKSFIAGKAAERHRRHLRRSDENAIEDYPARHGFRDRDAGLRSGTDDKDGRPGADTSGSRRGNGRHLVALKSGNLVYLKERNLLITRLTKQQIEALPVEPRPN